MSEFTVKQFAEKERVTVRTVFNWLSKGAVDYRRTPGGGIRILEPSEPRVVVLTMKSTETNGSSSA